MVYSIKAVLLHTEGNQVGVACQWVPWDKACGLCTLSSGR